MAALYRAPVSPGVQFASKLTVINDRRIKQRRPLNMCLIVRASDHIESTTSKDYKKVDSGQIIDGVEVLKSRFLNFKKYNYLANPDYYEKLAQAQDPKYFVVACCDSRVCPTKILGLQPGEAFTVRNIANLIPPYEHGPSETTAALEFAANLPLIGDILVIGHSKCGGINALMKNDSGTGARIKGWLSVGKSARITTKAAYGNLDFENQCQHCEKESINSSLLNLLTYPWIEERVNEGKLNLHGGYYNFVDCSFEYWTLDYRQGLEGGSKYAFKNRAMWS